MVAAHGFLDRVKGVILTPSVTFDSIIETRPPLTEPTAIFLSFGVASSLINGVASLLTPYARFPLPVIPASLLSPLLNAGMACLIILLILRVTERLKGLRWKIDLGLLYTMLGFSAVPLLIFSLYSRISFYAVSTVAGEPSSLTLLISKVSSAIFIIWSAYLLSLGLNRHYFRYVSPREHMASTLLGAFLILGAFNLTHPITLYHPSFLSLTAAIVWILIAAFALSVWSKARRYQWARSALIGVLALVAAINSGLLYTSVSEQEARVVEAIRTAEVELAIGVFTNGDVSDVTVMVPLPLFKGKPIDLRTANTLYEMVPPAYWGLTYLPLTLSQEVKPRTYRNQGIVVFEGDELGFKLDGKFTPYDNRTGPPLMRGRVVAVQHGAYLNLSISEIHESELFSVGFRFILPKDDWKYIGFPQPARLYGYFSECQPVSGSEKCDLRVDSGIRATLQVNPNFRSGFEVESIRGVFNETQRGWTEAGVFEPSSRR